MTDTTNTSTEQQQQSDADLGEAGRKALAEEREARKRAEREAKELRERVSQLEGAETRRKVAQEKGLTDEQAKFLSGDDEESMKQHADELIASFKPPEDEPAGISRRPVERLRPGAAPSAEPQATPSQVAERIRKGW